VGELSVFARKNIAGVVEGEVGRKTAGVHWRGDLNGKPSPPVPRKLFV